MASGTRFLGACGSLYVSAYLALQRNPYADTKLLRLIEDARTAGIDRVTHATYQTVLGTAPSLSAVMDPIARQSEQVTGSEEHRNRIVR